MKPVSIHPLSALSGAGLLGLLLLAAGAVQVPGGVQQIPTCSPGPVRIAGIPDPRQMVVIKEGTPFVVPADKLLAITGLGSTSAGGSNDQVMTLRVDGLDEIGASIRLAYGNGTTIAEPPPGFTAQAGSTVEVVSTGGVFGCAWGYLVDVAGSPRLVRVVGIPDPRNMVVIREGEPFAVPPGKVLAITGIGGVAVGVQATLQVDGLNQFVGIANWSLGRSCSVLAVPAGLAFHSGSSVAVVSGTGSLGRAWGYLVDA